MRRVASRRQSERYGQARRSHGPRHRSRRSTRRPRAAGGRPTAAGAGAKREPATNRPVTPTAAISLVAPTCARSGRNRRKSSPGRPPPNARTTDIPVDPREGRLLLRRGGCYEKPLKNLRSIDLSAPNCFPL